MIQTHKFKSEISLDNLGGAGLRQSQSV